MGAKNSKENDPLSIEAKQQIYNKLKTTDQINIKRDETKNYNKMKRSYTTKKVKEFKSQPIERFSIGKKFLDNNKNNVNNNANENLIEENKELEKKLKQMEEENKKLQLDKKMYTDLENKFKKVVAENKEFQNKAKNFIGGLMKLGKIENQTRILVINNKILFDNFKNFNEFNENNNTSNNNFFDYKKKLKIFYLRYLFFKKIIKQNKILGIYFNKLKEITKSLKLIEEEKNRILQKNKSLRDLFYRRITERKNEIHRFFTKFYYKGLLNSMEIKAAKDCMHDQLEKDKQEINEHIATENAKVENENIENKTENEETKNAINNNENKIQEPEIKEEKEKEKENNTIVIVGEEEPKVENKQKNLNRQRARNIRKLLTKKNKEKVEALRKYFFLFQCNGIMAFFKKSSAKKSQDQDEKIQEAIKIVEEEEKAKKVREEELHKKLEEEKQKKIEQEKYLEKLHKLEIIVNKKDRNIAVILNKYLGKWYLIAKIMSLRESIGKYIPTGIKTKLRSRKGKKGKRGKKGKKKDDENNKKDEDKKEENIENKEEK